MSIFSISISSTHTNIMEQLTTGEKENVFPLAKFLITKIKVKFRVSKPYWKLHDAYKSL